MPRALAEGANQDAMLTRLIHDGGTKRVLVSEKSKAVLTLFRSARW
jgi:hypothetical protein